MSLSVVGLVLFSAVLHASWNALLKGGADRLRSATIMAMTGTAISLVLVSMLPAPRQASWLYIGLSGALHVAYNILLVVTYREGDLGLMYPIARGSSPMLVTLGAAAVAGERLDLASLFGVVLISAGILGLARDRRGLSSSHSIIPALMTGATIAAYTVVDGIGARLSGDSRSYAAWLFLLDGLPMPLILMLRRRTASGLRLDAEFIRSALGGIVSMVAYAVVIWAASISPMGEVSALRETSVVFAALIGRVFLGEPLGIRRLAACMVVTLGAACLGYHHR